jgi:hypothetical protein
MGGEDFVRGGDVVSKMPSLMAGKVGRSGLALLDGSFFVHYCVDLAECTRRQRRESVEGRKIKSGNRSGDCCRVALEANRHRPVQCYVLVSFVVWN